MLNHFISKFHCRFIFKCLVIVQLISASCSGQDIQKVLVYKKIDTTQLHLTLYYPDHYIQGKAYPAIVFFFGGGWISGSSNQFEAQAKYLAALGMIGITADYRVQQRNHTTPFEAVSDAKSAVRYLRKNAVHLGIDPNKLAAGGGSAGGHLAAATDLIPTDNKNEDLNISSRPNALVLFNPVFNNGPGNYGYDRIGARYKELSPFHHIRKDLAPTIIFFGTKDQLVPVDTAKRYQEVMQEHGNRCELYFYEGQVHGFFNYEANGDQKYYLQTIAQAAIFLKSLGYIKEK